MMNERSYDAIVVGAGIAGLTSAAYLCRRGHRTLLLEKSDKVGGLVNTFWHDGFAFDGGIRAFENSGIVFPMLRQLGMDLDVVRSPVTIGIGGDVIRLDARDSLGAYRDLLCKWFPQDARDIDRIIGEIRKATRYMDVLYGIDNPLFLDNYQDMNYVFKTLLPWLLKYQVNIRKALKLDKPINDHLRQFTGNASLIDMITQHFFKDTPAFFALSYFRLYLDYSYPRGGTGALADKLAGLIRGNGGEIATGAEVSGVDTESRLVRTADGRAYGFKELVWCADMKGLYAAVDISRIGDPASRERVSSQRASVMESAGGDSVLTVFMRVDLDKPYFQSACGPHSFYTPRTDGLSTLGDWRSLASGEGAEQEKAALKEWVGKYLDLTTYEVSCPALRDASLAPEGKTGVIVSTLLDYDLAKRIQDAGWYDEFKAHCVDRITAVLNTTLFPGFADKVLHAMCSTPLTLERIAGNSGGAITGWAFTNRRMPAENRFQKIAEAIRTPIPHVFQAGQWAFSPSGLPVCILTGKLAADAVEKALRQKGPEVS